MGEERRLWMVGDREEEKEVDGGRGKGKGM